MNIVKVILPRHVSKKDVARQFVMGFTVENVTQLTN
jgi:hypothetical protein